jgi:CheY-like chemotaxis protein
LWGIVGAFDTITALIVEDEWLVRMELVDAFEGEGCDIVESASAEDALQALRTTQGISLLMTDIRLIGPQTGWDLAEQARELVPHLAVVYLSANQPEPDRIVPGAVFLEKPALMRHVVDAAQRVLRLA